MRVICPNCEQRGLIDAAALADVPVRTLCPRCDTPFRVSLFDEDALRDLFAATRTVPHAPLAAARNGLGAASVVAPVDGRGGDVLALPRAESRSGFIEQPICTVIDWGEELDQPHHARARTSAGDKYRTGARLLNASPLWLLVVGFAFLSFAVLCDRLLTSADGSRADAATLATFENQATNRAARRHARDDSQRDDAQEVTEAEAASDASDADDPVEAKLNEAKLDEAKLAPVSDPAAPRADAAATAAASSPADAPRESAQELTSGAPGAEPSPTKLTLQLASYRVKEEAQKLAEKLHEAGFEAHVVVEQHAKRPWYCVQTQNFDTREDVEQHLAELHAKNFASSYTVREVD
jgi:cell division protein FtsN